MCLQYPGLSVTLTSNSLAALARPGFYLRGAKGNYWKWGLDLQEEALYKITRIEADAWGGEPPANWGTLAIEIDGYVSTHLVEPFRAIIDFITQASGTPSSAKGPPPSPV